MSRGRSVSQSAHRPPWPAIAHAPRWRICPCFRQDTGEETSRGGLAHRSMAGGVKRNLVFALRGRADSAGFAGLEGFDAPSAGMAAHRMARGRKRADEILAFDPARRHAHRRSRRHGQIALAHRARLRGTQKRTRPRPFRRAKLARLPSSRNPVHRRLWIPDPRTSSHSPLRPPAAPNISHIHPSQTPRRRRSDPNDMSKTRSRQSEDNSRSRWLEPCCAARVAKPSQLDHLCDHPTEDRRDTVVLGACPRNGGFWWRRLRESDSACL